MLSRAHEELRIRYERGEFTIIALAKKAGCSKGQLVFVMGGTNPKVTIALALDRLLGIPVTYWAEPAEFARSPQPVQFDQAAGSDLE